MLNIFKPFLFGTIGAAIIISDIDAAIIPFAIIIICVALLVRCLATFCCVFSKQYNLKERGLFTVAWTPKATVQAVLGGLILDWAKSEVPDESPEKESFITYGNKILTTSVLAIIITAPLGAILTENLGK